METKFNHKASSTPEAFGVSEERGKQIWDDIQTLASSDGPDLTCSEVAEKLVADYPPEEHVFALFTAGYVLGSSKQSVNVLSIGSGEDEGIMGALMRALGAKKKSPVEEFMAGEEKTKES